MEYEYLDLLKEVLSHGELTPNRTGIDAYVIPHAMLKNKDQGRRGFPLLTTKKMAWKSIRIELEFFIKGLTDKRWLQDRGCHIWDEWCDPTQLPEGTDPLIKKQMAKNCPDLGPIYGFQWRQFNGFQSEDGVTGIDQLATIVNTLKKDPHNRQQVCTAWNPCQLGVMALPPCHLAWHVFITNGKLHLCWFQRSCDMFLGVPFNMASYGLLLHLLALELHLEEGTLTGFLSNVHIYKNHVTQVQEQLRRLPFVTPTIHTDERGFSIFNWKWEDTILENYQSHGAIKGDIAI